MKTKRTKSKTRETSPDAPEILITLKNWGGIKKQQWKGIPSQVEIESPWARSSLLGEMSTFMAMPDGPTVVRVTLSRGTESMRTCSTDFES